MRVRYFVKCSLIRFCLMFLYNAKFMKRLSKRQNTLLFASYYQYLVVMWLITSDGNFDHLVNMTPVIFLYYKLDILIFYMLFHEFSTWIIKILWGDPAQRKKNFSFYIRNTDIHIAHKQLLNVFEVLIFHQEHERSQEKYF